MIKQINIKTNNDKFFRQFLELIKSVPPISKLRPKELDVLSEIMYQNNKYSNVGTDVRGEIVFSTSTRKTMRSRLNISEENFNNNLSILRKHKIIVKNNRLMPFLESVLYNKEYTLSFIFKEN